MANRAPGKTLRTAGLVVIVTTLLGLLSSACDVHRTTFHVSLRLMGPLTGYIEAEDVDLADETRGDSPIGNVVESDQVISTYDGSYIAHFTVVAPGPAAIEIVTSDDSGGFVLSDGDAIRSRVVFIVSAPVGARLRLRSHTTPRTNHAPLEVDRDGDGTIDQELQPDFQFSDNDIACCSWFETTAWVDRSIAGEAHVRLSTTGEEPIERTYYWVFPSEDLPRVYDGPIVVTEPSHIFFASLSRSGSLEDVQEVRVLGGVPEIRGQLAYGIPQVLEFDEPGKDARLTFAGKRGQLVSARLTEASLGPFSCCAGRMELLGPDGSAVSEAIGLGTQPAKLETIELPDDGIYTLVVDPSLAYTGAVTVRIDDRSALTADVVIGADESTLSVAFPEQRGLVMFHGTRGQRVSVNVIVPDTAGCCATNIAVLAPDGRELVTGLATASANEGTRLVVALPVSGIYSIELTSATDRRGMVIVSVTDESGS